MMKKIIDSIVHFINTHIFGYRIYFGISYEGVITTFALKAPDMPRNPDPIYFLVPISGLYRFFAEKNMQIRYLERTHFSEPFQEYRAVNEIKLSYFTKIKRWHYLFPFINLKDQHGNCITRFPEDILKGALRLHKIKGWVPGQALIRTIP